MYQLEKAPGAELCNAEMAENIHQEILNSVKEHLWHRWDSAQSSEGLGWRPTGTPRPTPGSQFQHEFQVTYKHFRDLREGSCEQALAMAWDAHRQALAAAAYLKIK